ACSSAITGLGGRLVPPRCARWPPEPPRGPSPQLRSGTIPPSFTPRRFAAANASLVRREIMRRSSSAIIAKIPTVARLAFGLVCTQGLMQWLASALPQRKRPRQVGCHLESRPEVFGSSYFGVLEKTSRAGSPRVQRQAIPIHQTSERKNAIELNQC